MDFDEIDGKRKIKKVTKTLHLTDVGNAEKINDLFGDKIRFDHKRGRWLIWVGHRWQPDVDSAVNRLAMEAAQKRYLEAAEITDLEKRALVSKFAIASEAKGRLDAATGIAKSLLPIADKGDGWDTDPLLLSCKNGIVDLTTGLLRDGMPEDRITMSTRIVYDPQADCPRWKQFISEIFKDNAELIHYVQKSLGYTLIGSIREQVIYFGQGPGANGKSVFFSTIRSVLGEYSYSAPATLFQRDTRNAMSNDVAALEFKRLLMSSEILSATKINEQRLKKLSGGDTETARFLHHEYFEFDPVCKIWLFVNHLPQVDDDSYAFWRRVRLIPFYRKFEGKDRDEALTEKLKAELPGILNWMIEGCLLWQQEGLNPTPDVVIAATQEYQEENDVLSEFIFEVCVEADNTEIQASSLYYAYTVWAENKHLKGKDVISKKEFGRSMGDKYQKIHKNNGWFYKGITFKDSPEDEEK